MNIIGNNIKQHLIDFSKNNTKVKIVVDIQNINLQLDQRFLVPFMVYKCNDICFGFADKHGNIVIPAVYDKVFDDFYSENDVVRVGRRYIIDYGTKEKPNQVTYFHQGMINSRGEEIIPIGKYNNIEYTNDRRLLIVNRNKEFALIDIFDNIVVPFGKYDIIGHFVKGFSRVRSKGTNYYNIIDTHGHCIIPEGQFDNIWCPREQFNSIIVEKNSIRYSISYSLLEMLKKELDETGRIKTSLEDFLVYEEALQKNFLQNQDTIKFDLSNY